jgi:hypothetical protein
MATTTPPDSLESLWSSLSTASTPELISAQKLQASSADPLLKLRLNIRINSGYGILFSLLFLALFVYFDFFWVRFFLGVVLLGYVLAIVYNSYLLRRVLITPAADENIRIRLSLIYYRMKKALQTVEIAALFFYPFSLTAGFIMALAEEGKLEKLSTEPLLQGLLVACFVLFVPLCYYLTKWLNKIAFGKEVDRIFDLLTALDEEKKEEETKA